MGCEFERFGVSRTAGRSLGRLGDVVMIARFVRFLEPSAEVKVVGTAAVLLFGLPLAVETLELVWFGLEALLSRVLIAVSGLVKQNNMSSRRNWRYAGAAIDRPPLPVSPKSHFPNRIRVRALIRESLKHTCCLSNR